MTAIRKELPAIEALGSAAGFLDEIHELVQTLSLFEGFSREECAAFCEYMTCYGAPSHATILKEGDAGDHLVMVLTGQIDVIKNLGDSGEKTVAHIRPGGFVGEMSLIDGNGRFASCITTEPTDFAVLTRASLNEILIDHPRLGNKLLLILLQLMTSRLRDATTRMLPTIVGTSI